MMDCVPRILVADDDDTCRLATADLLRREGWACDDAPDAPTALDRLAETTYDVIVADIKMPGNEDLSLVREVGRRAPGVPVILITGYPNLETAIESHDLPVAGYLVKPVDVSRLLDLVSQTVGRVRAVRAAESATQRLSRWRDDLVRLHDALHSPRGELAGGAVQRYVDLTLCNIFESMLELKDVTEACAPVTRDDDPADPPPPARLALTQAIQEAIEVLDKTKRAFKSKDLGQLRKRLEKAVQSSGLSP
jgi:FixJ family two-component response regulator